MKQLINRLKIEKIWPLLIVLTGLLLSASITLASFSFSARKTVIIENPVEQSVLGIESTASAAPISSAEPAADILTIIPAPKPSLKPSPSLLISPSPASTPSSQPAPAPVVIHIISTPSPLSTPSPSPIPEPSPTPIAQKVSVEIKQPDKTLNFDLEITESLNLCQAMQKAKDEGKINSISISDKYLESFGTLFIEEINGFRNNWIFTVNGQSPNGCSLAILKNGDKVVWEFLNI